PPLAELGHQRAHRVEQQHVQVAVVEGVHAHPHEVSALVSTTSSVTRPPDGRGRASRNTTRPVRPAVIRSNMVTSHGLAKSTYSGLRVLVNAERAQLWPGGWLARTKHRSGIPCRASQPCNRRSRSASRSPAARRGTCSPATLHAARRSTT